jgi:hypothetical protein
MKPLRLLVVIAIALLGLQAPAVSANGCTATGYMRDGINLTAKLINPAGTVSSEVDATGCNIGVYYDQDGSIDGAEIHGANYFGVVNYGASVDIVDSDIHGIGESPFNGAQHGIGIYFVYGTDAAGTIFGNTVSAYQKGGIVVNGATASADVLDNTVTGLGRVDFIAQNGIQFGWGANGVIRGNTISDNFYTGTVGVGPNPGGQNPPGWVYQSAGLLLYQPGDVWHSKNFFSNNQMNLLNVP